MSDVEIWEHLAHDVTIDELVAQVVSPATFQRELVALLSRWAPSAHADVIEVGSWFGVTTALLSPDKFDKTLLDQSPLVLDKATRFFERLGQPVRTISGDALRLGGIKDRFDLVFSAGLLEHFARNDRRTIVAGMLSLAKPGGIVIAAATNHNATPYRVSYLWRRARGRWQYPRELRIADPCDEWSTLPNACLEDVVDLDHETIYHFLPRTLRTLFRRLDSVMHWEGYLKAVVLRRNTNNIGTDVQ